MNILYNFPHLCDRSFSDWLWDLYIHEDQKYHKLLHNKMKKSKAKKHVHQMNYELSDKKESI